MSEVTEYGPHDECRHAIEVLESQLSAATARAERAEDRIDRSSKDAHEAIAERDAALARLEIAKVALARSRGRLECWASDKWIKFQAMKYQDGMLGEYILDEVRCIDEALAKLGETK